MNTSSTAPDLNHISLYPLAIAARPDSLLTESVQTLLVVSHSIEDTVTHRRLKGTFYAGFQRLSAFLPQISRFRRLARVCGEVLVFAYPDVPVPAIEGVTFVELTDQAPLTQEWFIVFQSEQFNAALLTQQIGGEQPGAQSFGRGRDYQGAVIFAGDLVDAARFRLDQAMERAKPAHHDLHSGSNAAGDAYYYFNRVMIQSLEDRSQQILSLYTNLNQRTSELERLHGVVRTMVSQSAWEKLQSDTDSAVGPIGSQQEYTVLMTDIEGFTRLSEALSPADLLPSLNRYLDLLASTTYQSGGDVDKFLGDGMLAFFESPWRAVEAACTLQARVDMFNEQQLVRRLPVLPTRVGLASGPCVLAQVGSRDRQELTLLGNAVNTASRLQAKSPVGGMLMDHATYRGIGQPLFVLSSTVTIRGKSGSQNVFEIAPDQRSELQKFLGSRRVKQEAGA